MKKIIVVLLMSLLVGCRQTSTLDETVHLKTTLKPLPEVTEEKGKFYIYDDLLPTYGMLSSYPSEALIDWDNSTGIESEEWLSFKLIRMEAVRGIEVDSKNVRQLDIKINDVLYSYDINEPHEIIEFDESVQSDEIHIKTAGGMLNDVHIICDLEVDEKTYEVYQMIINDLILLENYDWSSDPKESFDVFDEVTNTFTKEKLEMLSKDIDMNRLKMIDKGIGCPYRLTGKVVSIKKSEHYNELTIDMIVDHEKITVYTLNDYEMNTIFQETCILIDNENTLKFITVH